MCVLTYLVDTNHSIVYSLAYIFTDSCQFDSCPVPPPTRYLLIGGSFQLVDENEGANRLLHQAKKKKQQTKTGKGKNLQSLIGDESDRIIGESNYHC